MPDLSLRTLSGRTVDRASVEGFLLVLYFFPAADPGGLALAGEVEFFSEQGREDEIRYLGVSPLPEERLRAFAEANALGHDLAADPDGTVTGRFLGEPRRAVFVIDDRGVVRFFQDEIDAGLQGRLRAALRDLLRELERGLRGMPALDLPWRAEAPAPGFAARDLGGAMRTSAEFRGRPLLVYFFEPDCDACPEVGDLVRDVQVRHRDQLAVIGVASRGDRESLRLYANERGLRFPILLDPERRVRRSFGAVQGDPDLVWVDGRGRVWWRELGDPPDLKRVVAFQARVLLGEADPAFAPGEYVGYRVCRVCHEPEFRDWMNTPHAVAGESLVADRAYGRDDCVPCHVTGFRRPGGYQGQADRGRMAHVQCEACHGPGGGHAPEAGREEVPWEARCLTCHVGPYVLEQPLDVSLAWMSHASTPEAATLFAYHPARAEDMRKYRDVRTASSTFRRGTPYAGSEACRPCHAAIHEEWQRSAHARALATLREAGSGAEPACLRCHVTGLGSLSGYRGRSTPALAGVGCEACHGPGGDHVVAPASMARATIYGLAPDCPSCLPEATCRACHDPQNDPGFRMPGAPLGRSAHRAGGRPG
jgi:peroxiredoxin